MGIFDLFKKKQKLAEYKCSSCGKVHDELPAIAFITPFYYDALNESDKKEIAEISSDFCVITYEDQIDRFIRTTLTIQINDACENLDYGVWVSLSEKSFNEYESEFKNNIEGKTYFGRICSDIIDYDESTLGLHVNVVTRSNGIRPEIVPHENEHKLVLECTKGITLNEALKRIEKMEKHVAQLAG